MFSQLQVAVFYFYILDTFYSIIRQAAKKNPGDLVKSKEISQNCLTNKGENAIMKIITVSEKGAGVS